LLRVVSCVKIVAEVNADKDVMELYNDDCLNILPDLMGGIDLVVTDPPYAVISGGTGQPKSPKGILSKNDGKIFEHNDIDSF